MPKVKLFVTEKLTYRREIDAEMPEEIEENDLNRILDWAQSGVVESVGDFVHNLREKGFKIGHYDDDFDSPADGEVECDDYEINDDD
ncbi:hypothetical protein [Paenibacillus alkalitolerans]|uniref:hypothetical protein n=1 Tax=Paenibacillus alkalitolerans TaxID=2799335 RepID=UPI0018F505EB|nr:hypothetical protein [Paenibacillus alkalitolerans]